MRSVMLLSDASTCDNASTVAFYLSRAFEDKENFRINLYCYINNTLYTYDADNSAFTNSGVLTSQAFSEDVFSLLGLNTPLSQNDEDEALFDILAKYVRYDDSMTSFDFSRLPEQLLMRASSTIAELHASAQSVCFVMCPNGRNLPARFQTYGHKLYYDNNNLMYKTRSCEKNNYQVNHLKSPKCDVAYVFIELLLARAIVSNPETRYLGNCYGSQLMWTALGGGLTTYKRNQNVQHNSTMIPPSDDSVINVNWDNGILETNKTEGLSQHPTETITSNDLYNFFNLQTGDLTFNSDYHHSFMLILSKHLDKQEQQGKITAVSHKLSDKIVGYTENPLVQAHEMKVVKCASENPSPEQGTPSGKVWRTWRWVGSYCCNQRIFGFQGHPLYHITEYSDAWNAEHPSDENNDQTARNAHYANNKTLIWNYVFNFA